MKHYDSIDNLPLYNWRKINETNDLRWMFASGKGQVNRRIAEAWQTIYDEYIDEFGINDKYLQILELKREIVKLTAELALTGDRSIETFIDIAKWELTELLKNEDKGQSFGTVKAYVEKYMGFHLDERIVSVRDYYNYLKLMLAEQPKKAA